MRIGQVEVVSAYDLDETAPLEAGVALKKLRDHLGGRLFTINTPEGAPPELPRIVLQLQDTVASVGLNRFSFQIQPPSHVSSSHPQSLDFVDRRVSSMLEPLAETVSYRWTGLVADLEFPMSGTTALEAVAPVFEQLLTINRGDRDLASFTVQFGFRGSEHFLNYTISGYGKTSVQVKPDDLPSLLRIDPNSLPPDEVGIQVRLDVNNKAQETKQGIMNDLHAVVAAHKAAYETLPADLGLSGVLS